MNLLLTGAWANARGHIAQLEAAGHSVRFMQQEADALPCKPEWVEGVVCNGLFQHHEIARFANLRYIQLTSAGLDRVPVDYIHKAGITLHNARGVYSAPMAEFALAGVLALYKQLPAFQRQQEAHVWEKHRNLRELAGKQVCIVGCGSVGQECAIRFAAMGCTVCGTDAHANGMVEGDGGVSTARWKTSVPLHLGAQPEAHPFIFLPSMLTCLMGKSDIVVLTVPLTPETHHLIGAEELSVCKPDAILVNLARGGLVDEAALAKALREGHLGGAVLDVFEEEPLPAKSPLWDMPNVIATPHNSFVGEANPQRLDAVIMANLEQWAASSDPRTINAPAATKGL